MTILQLILYIFERLYLLFKWRFISVKKSYKKSKCNIYATVANMLQFLLLQFYSPLTKRLICDKIML